jgi:hypothetical protein
VGEERQGLGTMADPAELVAAMTAIGLLQRGFTVAETRRAGGAEQLPDGCRQSDGCLAWPALRVRGCRWPRASDLPLQYRMWSTCSGCLLPGCGSGMQQLAACAGDERRAVEGRES